MVESKPLEDNTQLQNDTQKSDNECLRKEDQYNHEIQKEIDVKVKNADSSLFKELNKIPNQNKNSKDNTSKNDQTKVYKKDNSPKVTVSNNFHFKDKQKSHKKPFANTQNDNNYNGSLIDQNMQNANYQIQINPCTENNDPYHKDYDYTNQTDYGNYGDGSDNLYAEAGTYAHYDSMYTTPYYQKGQRDSQDYDYNYPRQDGQLNPSYNYCNNSYQNYNNYQYSCDEQC